MSTKARLKFDKIHYWSEIKLDIIKDYAFASQKPVAEGIIIDIFKRHQQLGTKG